jgi:hypothetical protein
MRLLGFMENTEVRRNYQAWICLGVVLWFEEGG